MINILAFTELIQDLKYNKSKDLFSFHRNYYKLKNVARGQGTSVCYFVNTKNASDIRKVEISSEIPIYDDFNKVKVDPKKREAIYQHLYYIQKNKEVRKERNKKDPEILKAQEFFKRKQRQLKRLIQKDIQEEIELEKSEHKVKKYCQKCGRSFTPVASNQRFCSDKCRQQYYHTLQSRENSNKARVIKTCPVCGILFEGYTLDKYCSEKCKKENKK